MGDEMVKCKACGNEIAKSAITCPSCGKRNRRPFWQILLIIIGVLVIISLINNIAGGSKDKNTSSNAKTNNILSKNAKPIVIDWEDFEFTPGYNVVGTTFQADFFWSRQDGKDIYVYPKEETYTSMPVYFVNAPQRYDFKKGDPVTIIFKIAYTSGKLSDIVSVSARR
jgi:RNA polymerase subunit RPABC4/transcription elongation factor Spt4